MAKNLTSRDDYGISTLTLDQLAPLLGVCTAFLRTEIARGQLRVARLGRRGLIRVGRSEALRYLKANTQTKKYRPRASAAAARDDHQDGDHHADDRRNAV